MHPNVTLIRYHERICNNVTRQGYTFTLQQKVITLVTADGSMPEDEDGNVLVVATDVDGKSGKRAGLILSLLHSPVLFDKVPLTYTHHGVDN